MTKRILCIIATSLAFSILPLTLRILHSAAKLAPSERLLQLSEKLVFLKCLYFCNHCLNPFLYFFVSWDCRKERNTEKQRKQKSLLMTNDDNI
ncbi:hypothetical protein LDENG_00155250 [Lucifuga dentata]|nr:hypothetical protein LDENG_00155250 [Lucifuga dentata]